MVQVENPKRVEFKPIVVLLAMILTGAVPTLAQTALGSSTGYCITGLSSAVSYSWWLDINDDGLGMGTEPFNLNAGAVLPSGASASDLAAALAGSISSNSTSISLGINSIASGYCLNLSAAQGGTCTVGLCVGGPNNGSACAFSVPDCGLDPNTPGALWVGTANQPPSCKVTAAGCSYNPTIVAGPVPVPTVPALGSWGMALLAVLLVTAGGAVLLRRLRAARRVI